MYSPGVPEHIQLPEVGLSAWGAMSAHGGPISIRFCDTEYLPPSFDHQRKALAGAVFTQIDANTFQSGNMPAA